jgi:tetratricopeptide (TPR) repeat protein
MYVEGDPFSRGAAFGRLNKELIFQQEKAFVDQIKVLVPNESYLKFLRYLLAFLNRGMDKHIPAEYLEEIYGISFSHPDTFDFVGEKYNRVLNYHAAHDIGHALRQYMLVGCTSFSAWGGMSEDSSLIIGRNFDFYVGDDFARNKTVAFFNPDKGNKFMTVTWPGFIGAVSGMNEHGLTVTLNAAASDPPLAVKTPIAILAREILQYASDIDEAFAIAQKRETFVSETIMVGSAKDGCSALIEKTPRKTVLYRSADEKLICSNHYQSPEFAHDKANLENIRTSDSPYRFRIMEELFARYGAVNPAEAALMLRERNGEAGTPLGLGNQKAVNQLIAHHGVIFKPQERKVWVSAPPYQLGAFVCYDLNEVFSRFPEISESTPMHVPEETIPADPFLQTSEYRGYENFRRLKGYIGWFAPRPRYQLDEHVLKAFEGSNPLFYHTHELLGDYYAARGENDKALGYYEKALSLEIATLQERESIEKRKQKLLK